MLEGCQLIPMTRLSLIIVIILHTHILTKKISAKVGIGSDRNYTFPTESKFSTKQINSPTNNYGAGDDNVVFPGNDNMTTMRR